MTRENGLEMLDTLTSNQNLKKHMLAVEAIMRALCRYFLDQGKLSENDIRESTPTELVDLWGITGLLHDADYEMFKDTDPKKHPSVIFSELEKRQADARIIQAIRSHAWGWREDLPEPESMMDWSLYTCDELSGLITACALVRPDRKLSSVTVESVLKKFPQKAFAAGAIRENIMYCESKLGIKLPDFIDIALSAMQTVHDDLGL